VEVRSFKGGIYIPHYKNFSEKSPIKEASLPEEIIIPLSQHIGAPCEPLVKEGDKVKAGQKIGESDSFVSAPVHASLSGTVKSIEERTLPSGDMGKCIVIDVDKEQEQIEFTDRDPDEMNDDEIFEAVKEAGIAGMGGAAFPTAVKIKPPKEVDSLILNGCECEPFLTCDHRIMLEKAEEMLKGTQILKKFLGVEKAYICIESNKMDAIKKLKEMNEDPDIVVVKTPTKYPQGSEKQLIKALLDREVPPGGLPFDVGTLVQNVGTVVAVYEAVRYSKPLIERVVSVTGPNLPEPQNLMIKIGTPVGHVIEDCGGLKETPAKVVVGGPMTGCAQDNLEVPVVKGTTGVTVLSPELAFSEPDYIDCVRCGKCVDQCPMLLYPNQLSIYCESSMYEEVEKWNVMDCVECGICAYTCPSKRPIVGLIQEGKERVQALQAKR